MGGGQCQLRSVSLVAKNWRVLKASALSVAACSCVLRRTDSTLPSLILSLMVSETRKDKIGSLPLKK